MNKIALLLVILSLFGSCEEKYPDITLPELFSNHMVLQQNSDVPIWGWATPETVIDLTTTWGKNKTISADKNGNWSIKIPTPNAGGPYSITLTSGRSIRIIDDVYIGEVWLASGQSNMEMPVKGWGKDMPIDSSTQEIASSDYPEIRMFTVKKETSYSQKKDCTGQWKVANPENTGDFSATAYFFAKDLYLKLKVPIGIIHSSWGGTPAESWTSKEFINNIKGFEDAEKKLNDSKNNHKKITAWLKDLKKVSFDDALKQGFPSEKNELQYSSTEFNDSDWKEIQLPAYWETRQLNNFDGIVWFRKEFVIPKGKDLNIVWLYLGKIDDMDETYINGTKVGSSLKLGFWDEERRYPVKDGLLHTGKNTISVKVIDNYGGGGMYGNRKIGFLDKKNDTVLNLSGIWKYKPVAVIKNENLYYFNANKTFSSMPVSTYSLDQYSPTLLYNAMIAPLIPYTIKGAIWYQGESNVGRAKQYETLFPMMIKSWRKAWNNGDFPFYYVQIAPFFYNNGKPTSAAELRYAQLLTLKENNVGMVVTTDIGNVENIHPSNKQDVGKRLALWALNKTYGDSNIIYSGPMVENIKFEKNKAIISFTNTAEGLETDGEKLHSFEIAGSDSVFYEANAIIDKNKVIVSYRKVKKPEFVRFGWKNDAEPNLFNSMGLPASPFKN
jgi:sialate O-acetylesterase